MVERVENGKTYVKRSFRGKARRVIAREQRGIKVVCVCEDNGKTLIISRYRLHRDSLIMVDSPTFAPSDELAAQLDKLLAGQNSDES